MTKTHFYIYGSLLTLSISACNGYSNPPGQTTSTGTNADSTTTATSTTVHRRYSGNFVPQDNTKYIDLKTQREISVRIDTVRGQLINSETNEPEELFVDPVKHDTIYGQTGAVVNNYITHDDGGYRVDTVRVHDTVTTTTEVAETGRFKEKNKNGKEKIKTDDEKFKVKKNKEKEKDR